MMDNYPAAPTRRLPAIIDVRIGGGLFDPPLDWQSGIGE